MAPNQKSRNKKRLKIESKKRHRDPDLIDSNYDDINPFELRHNKIKHRILGRKLAKNEFGKPLINRNRAYKKREQTLLKEYKYKHKSGKGLQDLRESNPEQRVIKKYQQQLNQINLNENDTIKLTHKGKPLEDLIDDRLSDEDDCDLFNRDDYVETSHFGGGQDGPPRSRNEIINEIMDKKLQKKREKEETIMLTQKLDSEWNEIKNLIRHKGPNLVGNDIAKQVPEDYDNLLTQLVFDDQNIVKEKESLPKTTNNEQNMQTPDALFKAKLNLIDNSKNVDQIIRTIEEVIRILSKISKKSYFILKDRLISLTETNLKFTPKEISILIIAAYFKEFQILIHLIILKTLNKIKFVTLNEVACAIFLNNFILKTTSEDKFYPELFIHLENLICLCLPQNKTKIKLFHRMEHEVECILNVSKFSNKLKLTPKYTVTLINLFENNFKNDESSKMIIAYNLAFQVFELIAGLFNKNSSHSRIGFTLQPIVNRINNIIESMPNDYQNHLKTYALELVKKLQNNRNSSTKSIIINNVQPKPFILPLLEPKYDEDFQLRPKLGESKKLIKKVKREFKGAQREIRKDSTFLRDTYLKEMEKKDRIRNKKVKEILKDISIQQGLYKKK